MQPMIEIDYLNGRKRRITDSAFVEGDDSMTSVIDIGFHDLSEGLRIFYKHYKPIRPDMKSPNAERDAAGLQSFLLNDGYVVLATPSDLATIEKVYYEGKLELFRFKAGGPLVNLHKVNSAQMLYLDNQGEVNTRLKIAELYAAMTDAFKNAAGANFNEREIREGVYSDLGLEDDVVDECLEYQKTYALNHKDYAIANFLPYADPLTGEVVDPEDPNYGRPSVAPLPSRRPEDNNDAVGEGRFEPGVLDANQESGSAVSADFDIDDTDYTDLNDYS